MSLMIEKPRLLLAVIVISFIAVGGLYSYALSIDARDVSISEITEKEVGTVVSTSGYIKQLREGSTGFLTMELVDVADNASILVSIPSEVRTDYAYESQLLPGAEVRVSGLVNLYKESLSIEVSASRSIQITRYADENLVGIQTLLERPYVFEGMLVTVEGEVGDIRSAYEFILKESSADFSNSGSYSLTCYIEGGTQISSGKIFVKGGEMLGNGDSARVQGIFKYYPNRGLWQLETAHAEDVEKL